MKKTMPVLCLCALAVMAGASTVDAVQPMVAADFITLGLKSDGTVLAAGSDAYSNFDVIGQWQDILQVAAGCCYTVGLKSDDTIVADSPWCGNLDIGSWQDLTQVAVGMTHIVGLKSDGTVVAEGLRMDLVGEVGDWQNITQIAVGGCHSFHTAGLKNDGTVLAVGSNQYGQLDVGTWTEITQVVVGANHTIGLKSDGTVVAAGLNWYGQLDVGDWRDITQVATGLTHTVGLKSDGTVVAVGENDNGQCDVDDWHDILQVDAGEGYTIGLKTNGTVVAVGKNDMGQPMAVDDWMLYVGPNQYGSVEGQVADASGVFEGVAVELFNIGKVARTTTNADGYYRFEDVAEGHYRVHVIPPEASTNIFYITDARLKQVTVQPETTQAVDFVMTKMNLDIYGDGDIDQEDIQVITYLRGEDTTLCPDCDMDDDGAITGLDARKAVVQCTRPGCAVE